jgi:ribonuclease HI
MVLRSKWRGGGSLCRKVRGSAKKKMRNTDPAPSSVPGSPKVIAAVDGSCLGNPGPGGWAVVLAQVGQEVREWSRSCAEKTTNNRMELAAALSAVQEGNALQLQRGDMAICTDSEYVRRGITEWVPGWKCRGWKTAAGAPIKNADLWSALDREASCLSPKWLRVRAHCKDTPAQHERADKLARAAARSAALLQTRGGPDMPALSP